MSLLVCFCKSSLWSNFVDILRRFSDVCGRHIVGVFTTRGKILNDTNLIGAERLDQYLLLFLMCSVIDAFGQKEQKIL